jgi:hypothetical protein
MQKIQALPVRSHTVKKTKPFGLILFVNPLGTRSPKQELLEEQRPKRKRIQSLA